MTMRLPRLTACALALAATTVAAPAFAQACHGGASFAQWLEGVKQEARSQGISEATLQQAQPYLVFDQSVVNRDRGQGVFSQTFLEFSDRMVNQNQLDHGARNLRQHASVFARIEQEYGVPAAPIAAFWGLETDYGANIGNLPTLRSLASMGYDCRRPDLFRRELLAALGIVERGDLRADQMIGPWAGELGQLQFLPSHYLNHAVDADGDGRRDLLRSAPDALVSAGALMVEKGWRRGEPWLEEVRVSSNVPWDQADLSIRHPRTQWAGWGVTRADGSPLPSDGLPAALILPMGRDGPAFLAYRNFDVFLEWNQSLVYATTAAYFATRLAGAPRVGRGSGVASLGLNEIRELQQILANRGHDVGRVDGIIGVMTRAAVKAEQERLGVPADSFPTRDLLARLRQGG